MIRVWWGSMAGALRAWWRRHGTTVLVAIAASMAAAAAWRLTSEVPRLVVDPHGALDLRQRHNEVRRWFAGFEFFHGQVRGDYPPASYVLLWPLVGWLDVDRARWLWALTILISTFWLARIAVRETGARSPAQRAVLILLPFSTVAAAGTIAMGQLGLHLLPLILAGLLRVHRDGGQLRWDVVASAFLVAALVKPPFSVPFLLVAFLTPSRWRPFLLVSGGYVALSVVALALHGGSFWAAALGWAGHIPNVPRGHTNIHKWLTLIGLQSWVRPASLVALGGLAWWVWRHRQADIWLLMGVCGLTAQLWMHHRLYDQLLILVPLIALFRLARQRPDSGHADVLAGLLFGLTWLTLHAPARWFVLPAPWSGLMEAIQAAVWLAVLAFFVACARTEAGGIIRPSPGRATA